MAINNPVLVVSWEAVVADLLYDKLLTAVPTAVDAPQGELAPKKLQLLVEVVEDDEPLELNEELPGTATTSIASDGR